MGDVNFQKVIKFFFFIATFAIIGVILAWVFCFNMEGAHASTLMASQETNLYTSYSPGHMWESYTANSQTFVASVSSNITTIKTWVWQSSTTQSNELKLCEIPSSGNGGNIGNGVWVYCLDTPVNGTLVSRPTTGSAGWQIFSFNYPITVGHYYMFGTQNTSGLDEAHPGYDLPGDYEIGSWCFTNGNCVPNSGSYDRQFEIYTTTSVPTPLLPNIYDLMFFYNPYLCSSNSSCMIRYAYDNSTLSASLDSYDYFDVYELEGVGPTTTAFIASSTIFDLNDPLNRKQGGHSFFTMTSTSTTDVYYSVIPHLYNPDTGGFSTENAYTMVIKWADILYNNDLAMFSTSSDELFGVDTHKMACTDEQWVASSSIPFTGINLELWACQTKKWILDIGIKPVSWVLARIEALKTNFLSVFPFNIIEKMRTEWASSTAGYVSFLSVPTAYASDYSTTTGIASTSGFSIHIGNFLGTPGTTTINLLSKANITNLIGDDGYLIYYSICRFFVWGIFLTYLYILIRYRLGEIL